MSFHPSYTFSDSDIVVSSKDGIKFQVHSFILKRASGFFRNMLEMQRDSTEGPTDPIQMDESQEVVKALLDTFYPEYSISPSDIKSFDFLRNLAVVFVEKYDVPAGVAAVRDFFYDTRILSALSPILLYGLAKGFSWREEASVALKATLDVDFRTPDAWEKLAQLCGQDVAALIEMRHSKRQSVLDALVIKGTNVSQLHRDLKWYSACIRGCPAKGAFEFNPEWEAFRFLVSEELESRPSGSGLESLQFWDHPLVRELSQVGKCPGCKSTIFTLEMVRDAMRSALRR